MTNTIPPVALSIAGSDSGGGAGIQADLKTFTALGVFGASAITSVTSQNTVGVHAVRDLPPDTVHSQIIAVMDDLKPAAVKTGMLSSTPIVEAVAEELERYGVERCVVDPVMVSESGHDLLQPDARTALIERVLPLALVATPNQAEAEVLSGLAIGSIDEMESAAKAIHGLGPQFVLVKGGHLEGAEAVDVLYDGSTIEHVSAPRIQTTNLHGTGCTYAAAIAAHLARGDDVFDAVTGAKQYVTGAIRHGFALGEGAGPLNHFWNAPPR